MYFGKLELIFEEYRDDFEKEYFDWRRGIVYALEWIKYEIWEARSIQHKFAGTWKTEKGRIRLYATMRFVPAIIIMYLYVLELVLQCTNVICMQYLTHNIIGHLLNAGGETGALSN